MLRRAHSLQWLNTLLSWSSPLVRGLEITTLPCIRRAELEFAGPALTSPQKSGHDAGWSNRIASYRAPNGVNSSTVHEFCHQGHERGLLGVHAGRPTEKQGALEAHGSLKDANLAVVPVLQP